MDASGEVGGSPSSIAPALWLVDKPAGPTSHDVVAGIRRRLGGSPRRGPKVGHAGTLDPFATGLLVVLVGRATRLADHLSGLDKSYLATVRLGARSASGDPEGPITPGGPVPGREQVAAALPGLCGRQRQRVPPLAAVRVDGQRAYRRARRGEEVATPEREIEVHALELVPAELPEGCVRVSARVSKGTYLRQLAVDLGERLGCGAYCAALRRTAVGALTLARAVAPEEVTAEGGIPLREGLAHLPARTLDAGELADVRHGRVLADDGGPSAAGPIALLAEGRLVAIARREEGGRLRPAVVLG